MLAQRYIGIDIGKSKIARAVISKEGEVSEWKHVPTRLDEGGDAILQQCVELIEEGRLLGNEPIAGIGVGASGVVDPDAGAVISSGSIPNWSNVPLSRILGERFRLPVSLQNDVSAAALAEHTFGAALDFDSSVYLVISTGVGFAFVQGTSVWRGAHDLAGQIAHLPLFGNGKTAVAAFSGRGIADAGSKALGRVVSTSDVFTAAENGASQAEKIIAEAVDTAAQVIAWIQNTIDPDVIVFGGSVALKAPRFINAIRDKLPDILTAYQARLPDGPNLIRSTLGEFAGVIGSVCPFFTESN